MTWRKRLRIVLAALTQQWSEKTCGECGAKWMHQGPPTELAESCDNCRTKEFEKFMDHVEKEAQMRFVYLRMRGEN